MLVPNNKGNDNPKIEIEMWLLPGLNKKSEWTSWINNFQFLESFVAEGIYNEISQAHYLSIG